MILPGAEFFNNRSYPCASPLFDFDPRVRSETQAYETFYETNFQLFRIISRETED